MKFCLSLVFCLLLLGCDKPEIITEISRTDAGTIIEAAPMVVAEGDWSKTHIKTTKYSVVIYGLPSIPIEANSFIIERNDGKFFTWENSKTIYMLVTN